MVGDISKTGTLQAGFACMGGAGRSYCKTRVLYQLRPKPAAMAEVLVFAGRARTTLNLPRTIIHNKPLRNSEARPGHWPGSKTPTASPPLWPISGRHPTSYFLPKKQITITNSFKVVLYLVRDSSYLFPVLKIWYTIIMAVLITSNVLFL